MRHFICCGVTNHDMERVCIYPKDVSKIIGVSERQAQRLLKEIRTALNKKKHQYVTVKEFAEYTGIDEGLIDLE